MCLLVEITRTCLLVGAHIENMMDKPHAPTLPLLASTKDRICVPYPVQPSQQLWLHQKLMAPRFRSLHVPRLPTMHIQGKLPDHGLLRCQQMESNALIDIPGDLP